MILSLNRGRLLSIVWLIFFLFAFTWNGIAQEENAGEGSEHVKVLAKPSIAFESKEIFEKLLLQPSSKEQYFAALIGSIVAMTVLLLRMHDRSDAKNITWTSSMICILFGLSVLIVSAAFFKLYLLHAWEGWIQSTAANPNAILFSIAKFLTQAPAFIWQIAAAFIALVILVIPITRILFASSYSSSLVAWAVSLFVGWAVIMGVHFAAHINERSAQILEDKKSKPARTEDSMY